MKIKDKCTEWFLIFLAFSFIGWLYEILVFCFELGYGYVNRGFLFGPYLPVYGFGGILMVIATFKLKNKRIAMGKVSITPLICFLIAVFLATLAELLTSYLMELVIGEWLWDYTNEIPNFQGRIALKSSLRFGVMGIIGLYLVHPLIEECAMKARKVAPALYNVVAFTLLFIFTADLVARPFLGSNYVGP